MIPKHAIMLAPQRVLTSRCNRLSQPGTMQAGQDIGSGDGRRGDLARPSHAGSGPQKPGRLGACRSGVPPWK